MKQAIIFHFPNNKLLRAIKGNLTNSQWEAVVSNAPNFGVRGMYAGNISKEEFLSLWNDKETMGEMWDAMESQIFNK